MTIPDVMKKNLIIYFSKTGNCKFIAEKLADPWEADLREAKASMRSIGWMFLFSALG
jgi:flavodoxin